MAISVKPVVEIDGVPVACTPEALDREPVAIRGFKIEWGRADYHDSDAEPASLSLSLADATGEWARRIRESRAIGRRVVVRWRGTSTVDAEAAPVDVVQFRGRITTAHARPMDSTTATGARHWEVEISAADSTATMGATTIPATWPQESMLVRANRIKQAAAATGAGLADVYFWPGYVESRCAPLDTERATPLALMGDFYKSMGNDSWAYDPDANVVRQAIRLSQPLQTHLGSFDDTRGAVIPVPSDIEIDGVTYPGIGIGACEVAGSPEVTADPSTDINRLECKWHDYSTGFKEWTTIKEEIPIGDAPRAMAWASWFDAGEVIDPTLANVWDRVRQEGRRPRHPNLTRPVSDSFPTERIARWWLQAWENTRPAYLAGSLAWLWLMGDNPAYPPIVAPIGGTTTYHAGRGYEIELRVHWIHNTTPPNTPVRWQDLQQVRTSLVAPSIPWWYELLGIPSPPPVPVGQPTPERDLTWGEVQDGAGYRFGSSVVWGDMQHVPASGAQIQDHLT